MRTILPRVVCICLATLVVATGAARARETSVTLTRDGAPAAVVVTADQPTKSAQMAALELQLHIRMISGAELPIVKASELAQHRGQAQLLVGPSAVTDHLGVVADPFQREEYLITFYPDKVVLLGSDTQAFGNVSYQHPNTWPDEFDDNGTLRAACDFLRRYGNVRWFNPTAYGTDVVEQKTLVVTGDTVRRQPFLRYRGGSAAAAAAQAATVCWDWRSEAFKKWEAMGYPSERPDGLPKMHRNHYNQLFVLRQGGGGELSQCNHSVGHLHARYWAPNPKRGGDQVFVEHRPDLFALPPEGGKPHQPNFLSDDLVEITVQDIHRYFKTGHVGEWTDDQGKTRHFWPKYRWGKRFYALEPNDGGAYDTRPEAVAMYRPDVPRGAQSNYWFSFVNKVAKRIKESHPDKRISVLAYGSHEAVPDFPLEDNVVVHFCYSANAMPYNRAGNQMQLDNLKAWLERGSPMYLWLYHCFPREKAMRGNFAMFPGFFAHEFAKQMKYFQEIGIQGIFHCGWGEEVDDYVIYRLMDDPNLDVDVLLDEYFQRMYGPAAEPVQKMYTLVEETYCDPANYPPNAGHQNTAIAWEHLGTAERMAKLDAWMKQAHQLARSDLHKRRVAMWDQGIYQYMAAGRRTYVERMASPIPEGTAPRVPAANGDPKTIAWDQVPVIAKGLHEAGSATPVEIKVTGQFCHDGEFLYLRLSDYGDPKKLNVSPTIAAYDDWEVFIGRQRGQPFRQYMVGPTAMKWGFSWGEVNWRQCVPAFESGTDKCFNMTPYSDTSGDAWVLDMVFPLKDLTEKPLQPGETFYCNLIRVRGPEQAGTQGLRIETWVSHMTVKEFDRAAKVTLAR